MEKLRILLVWQHSLLRDTVRAILEQAGLTLVGEVQGSLPVEQVRSLRPDVVLVEDDGQADHWLNFLSSLEAAPRLIRISLEDNQLHIYQREERIMTQRADLLAALQNLQGESLSSKKHQKSREKENGMAGEKPWFQQPRKLLPLLVVFLVLAAGAVFGLSRVQAAPAQPIAFDHSVHIENSVQCAYCHAGVLRGQTAGLPTLSKCMGCHDQIEPDTPALVDLAKYAENNQTIEWVPVAMQPDFVYFSHRPHVSSGLNCETCHGEVGTMTVAQPQKGQNMGWCLSCHKGLAPEHFVKLSDCATCHK